MSEQPKIQQQIFIKVSDVPKFYSIGRDKIYRWNKEVPQRIVIHKIDRSALVKVADLNKIFEDAAT
ncbi:hypothetical protein [Parasedimentitalea psychrophila]|uniref:Uncharacterized protein n=1 Tax=Parasedimentitalea psychrophila TaxID=2997337 RepID=A0A9Y2P5I5_9RHOB|nr:hypothetical protein [Parasedimentitalea psychrophila]WIY23625.1 hypothetical protein QPJ95_13270 [Parasedimentitalea psychrophila]